MDTSQPPCPKRTRRRLLWTIGAGIFIGIVLGVLAVIVLVSIITVMISLP